MHGSSRCPCQEHHQSTDGNQGLVPEGVKKIRWIKRLIIRCAERENAKRNQQGHEDQKRRVFQPYPFRGEQSKRRDDQQQYKRYPDVWKFGQRLIPRSNQRVLRQSEIAENLSRPAISDVSGADWHV